MPSLTLGVTCSNCEIMNTLVISELFLLFFESRNIILRAMNIVIMPTQGGRVVNYWTIDEECLQVRFQTTKYQNSVIR